MGPSDLAARPPLERRAQDLDPAHEVPVVEKQGPNPLARGLAEAGGQRRFSQELDDRITERSNVSRVLDQQSTVQMLDLVEMTPDRARDDGTGFPHRLSHSKAEPLLQALLDHDRGLALDRVHHRVVLLGRGERQAGEMNPRARRGRQPPPAFADLSEHGCRFGVIGDLVRVGAREQEVRVARR